MKKFYWSALKKKVGLKSFIGFIISVLAVAIAFSFLVKSIGFLIAVQSICLSIAFECVKNFYYEMKEFQKNYMIEEEKKN